MLVFLKLYLAHLIADFILQPEWIARNKQRISPLIAHSFIHFLTALILINTGLTGRIVLVLVVLGILHAISDYIKSTFTQDNRLAFTSDQIVHLVIIIGASIWLSTDPTSNGRMVFDWLTKSRKNLFVFVRIHWSDVRRRLFCSKSNSIFYAAYRSGPGTEKTWFTECR